MGNLGDTRGRQRPVVVLTLLAVIAGALLACPGLLAGWHSAASGPSAITAAAAEAGDHVGHSSAAHPCSSDADGAGIKPALLVDRSGPGPSVVLAGQTAHQSISYPSDLLRARWRAPDEAQRSGRVLLNDLVVARI